MIQAPSPERPATRRRAVTRDRLLDAALEVFGDAGFGHATVEQICARAGYTRGAFYSNFTSLDELFLAMWERQSARMLDDLRRTADEILAGASRPRGDSSEMLADLDRILDAIPVDARWYRITAEFTAHVLRNPSLRRVVAGREEAILAGIMPVLESLLERSRRRAPDPLALGRALVAVHDGTAVQCLMEPDDPRVWRARRELFHNVIASHTTEIQG